MNQRRFERRVLAALFAAANAGLALAGCGSDAAPASAGTPDASNGGAGGSSGSGGSGGGSFPDGGGGSAGSTSVAGAAGASGSSGSAGAPPCSTRISYGSAWIRPENHPLDHDDVDGFVTWDGSCSVDASGNAFAKLSNGWQPYFQGKNCIIALDYFGGCDGAPAGCETRIHYGASWLAAPNHPESHDDVSGVVSWNGVCKQSGGSSTAELSNGWVPHFSGAGACDLSFRYSACGGLYDNPVVDQDCPDPGVMKDGDTFYMVCTPGPQFPIRSSKDLVSWTLEGTIFSAGTKPSWAVSHFWAPELARVGDQYVAYFSAKHSNGAFAIGAATSKTPKGPYTDIGAPLVTEPSPGAIDAHYFRASNGKHYVLWKIDGNAVGASTPIKIQELAPDGLSRIGSATTLLTNTLAWEGPLVEGPFMVEKDGSFYLFYSGNGYASSSYGVGVAKASSPLGPFTKKGAPILSTEAGWAGPGHGSILPGPSGDWVHVYHAWVAGKVGQAPGRIVLVDRVQWQDGWPEMRAAPSSRSQPLP